MDAAAAVPAVVPHRAAAVRALAEKAAQLLQEHEDCTLHRLKARDAGVKALASPPRLPHDSMEEAKRAEEEEAGIRSRSKAQIKRRLEMEMKQRQEEDVRARGSGNKTSAVSTAWMDDDDPTIRMEEYIAGVRPMSYGSSPALSPGLWGRAMHSGDSEDGDGAYVRMRVRQRDMERRLREMNERMETLRTRMRSSTQREEQDVLTVQLHRMENMIAEATRDAQQEQERMMRHMRNSARAVPAPVAAPHVNAAEADVRRRFTEAARMDELAAMRARRLEEARAAERSMAAHAEMLSSRARELEQRAQLAEAEAERLQSSIDGEAPGARLDALRRHRESLVAHRAQLHNVMTRAHDAAGSARNDTAADRMLARGLTRQPSATDALHGSGPGSEPPSPAASPPAPSLLRMRSRGHHESSGARVSPDSAAPPMERHVTDTEARTVMSLLEGSWYRSESLSPDADAALSGVPSHVQRRSDVSLADLSLEHHRDQMRQLELESLAVGMQMRHEMAASVRDPARAPTGASEPAAAAAPTAPGTGISSFVRSWFGVGAAAPTTNAAAAPESGRENRPSGPTRLSTPAPRR